MPEGSTIDDMFDAMVREAKGDKVFSENDIDRINKINQIEQNRIDAEAIVANLKYNPEELLQKIRQIRASGLIKTATKSTEQIMKNINGT